MHMLKECIRGKRRLLRRVEEVSDDAVLFGTEHGTLGLISNSTLHTVTTTILEETPLAQVAAVTTTSTSAGRYGIANTGTGTRIGKPDVPSACPLFVRG